MHELHQVSSGTYYYIENPISQTREPNFALRKNQAGDVKKPTSSGTLTLDSRKKDLGLCFLIIVGVLLMKLMN